MRIACILTDLFEDSEFEKPYRALRDAGHEVTIVGLKQAEVQGEKGSVRAQVQRTFADARPEDYDALFIPGGYSPDRLRASDDAVGFVAAFMSAGKPVLAICHGPQILITADAVKGRRMTAWKTVQGDLRKVGADVVDEEVVLDGNLVTSRKPDDIPAFIREGLQLLERVPV